MITRRKLLVAATVLPLGVRAHPDMGRVTPPRPAPRIPIMRADGRRDRLDDALRGRTSALQLIFTGCSSVCPIQGALFAAAQARAPDLPLFSLSVDPLGDDPPALTAWLAKHDAKPGWRAAAPTPEALEPMRAFFAQAGAKDDHSTQVYVFDRDARLVWRTAALPTPEAIIAAVEHFSNREERRGN